MRAYLLSVIMLFGMWSAALAEPLILSAPEAEARVAKGEMVLLDIRSREEWRETGVATGAWPVSMHERDFGERLRAILKEVPAENIALICATGGRSAHVRTLLERNNIEGVIDVSEGMMGNSRGPGWIARGMAIVPMDEALRSYEDAIASW